MMSSLSMVSDPHRLETLISRRSAAARIGRAATYLVCLAWLIWTPNTAAQDSPQAIEPVTILVRQTTSDTVYLNAGRTAGLVEGQRLKVLRAGELVAEVEVSFLSSSSASCRVLERWDKIQEGDEIVPGPLPISQPEASEPKPSTASESPPPERTESRRPPRTRRARGNDPGWGVLSGNVSLRYQSISDDLPGGRDFDQSTARLNLVARNLGGTAHEVRIRARTRQDQRTSSDGRSESQRNDRLYEASLRYHPEDGRLSYQLGRLTSGPLVGFDYLDGVLAEVRLTPTQGVVAFYGNRSDIEEFGLAEDPLTSYGGFYRHRNRQAGQPFYSEFLVGVVGEYREGEVNREYLSVYGRQGSGSRWSLYERIEVDFNRDWKRDTSDSGYQISNVLLSASYRFAPSARLSFSYDQRQRFRELEDRETPEERFDDQLRQGARLTAYLGPPRGVRFTGSVGLRRREDSSEDNLTWNGSLYHANIAGWGLFLAADYSSFSGDTSEGSRYGLRIRKYLGSGHDLGLTLGSSTTTLMATGLDTTDEWVRISGTAQLPKRFFLIGEYEISQGDTLEGQRYFLQLGYRF